MPLRCTCIGTTDATAWRRFWIIASCAASAPQNPTTNVNTGYRIQILNPLERIRRGKRKEIEMDFIANQGSKRYYIQSAFALPDDKKRAQKERPLVSVGDSFKKNIIVGGSTKLSRNERGVTTMDMKELLLNPDSLDL